MALSKCLLLIITALTFSSYTINGQRLLDNRQVSAYEGGAD